MTDSIEITKKFALPEQEEITKSLAEKFEALKESRPNRFVLLSTDELDQMLSQKERDLVAYILSIDPAIFGINAPFLGKENLNKELIAIKNQIYKWKGELKDIKTQYLPEDVYESFKKMNEQMQTDNSGGLLVLSGYRSPAYQVLVFCYWLNKNKCDIKKTARKVMLPGYSEHGFPKKQAIDFITKDGVIWGDEITFEETSEYKWLLKNAQKFNFQLSYPKNNSYGIIFEPWHWHYSK